MRCMPVSRVAPCGYLRTRADLGTVDVDPVWAAALPGSVKPLRRAARHDGFFPVNLEHPDQLADIVTTMTGLRQGKTTRYDVAVALPPGADPAPYAKAGATWWLAELEPETVSLDQVRGVLRDGPAEIGIERIR
jgi:hypothetical protein